MAAGLLRRASRRPQAKSAHELPRFTSASRCRAVRSDNPPKPLRRVAKTWMAGTRPGHDGKAAPIVICKSSKACVTSLLLFLARARRNEIRPRSQADLPCPVPPRKIFLFLFFRIHDCIFPSRPIERGASRTSRNVGAGCDGRFSPQRASSARTNDGSRTAKSRGPDTPTLVSSLRRSSASRGRRWPESPVHRGDRV